MLDQGRSVIDADKTHWTRFLVKRQRFIEDVVRRVLQDKTLESADQARRVAALKGSLGRLALITPALCERYLHAWVADRQCWNGFLGKPHIRGIQQLPDGERRRAALTSLSRPGSPGLTWQFGGNGQSLVSSDDARPFSPSRPRSASAAAASSRRDKQGVSAAGALALRPVGV